MSAVAVIVTWAPDKVGKPSNGLYSTLGRFEGDPKFTLGGWSVTLRFDPTESMKNPCEATAEFLFPDRAPSELLVPGARFEMMEGRRMAAQVVVQ